MDGRHVPRGPVRTRFAHQVFPSGKASESQMPVYEGNFLSALFSHRNFAEKSERTAVHS
jgi:hypothetical protein